MRLSLDTEKLIAEIDDGIGWITFNNPERRNAITVEMWEAIPEAVARLEADPEVRVLVLRGAGDAAFVSGADISEFESRRTGEEAAAYEELNHGAYRAVAETRPMRRRRFVGRRA